MAASPSMLPTLSVRRVATVCLCATALGADSAEMANLPSPLTNAQQVLALSHIEARQLRPVKLQGVVTYFAPERGWFWLQDATAPVLVAPTNATPVTEG